MRYPSVEVFISIFFSPFTLVDPGDPKPGTVRSQLGSNGVMVVVGRGMRVPKYPCYVAQQ